MASGSLRKEGREGEREKRWGGGVWIWKERITHVSEDGVEGR